MSDSSCRVVMGMDLPVMGGVVWGRGQGFRRCGGHPHTYIQTNKTNQTNRRVYHVPMRASARIRRKNSWSTAAASRLRRGCTYLRA